VSDGDIYLPIGHYVKDYQIIAVLGSGGFGVTYKAEDSRNGDIVAVKEYIPGHCAMRLANLNVGPRERSMAETFAKGVDSFLQEAQTLAQFTHPNIVPIKRYFTLPSSTAYFVMPFFEGKTLAELVRESPGGRQNEVEIRIWLEELMKGLKEIHAKGVLHRDIKPENIFVKSHGDPMLIDFGSARNALALYSRTVSSVLTPGYAPPEQYSSVANIQGPWTDIYAVGAVIYFCLTGIQPIDSLQRQVEIMNGDPDPMAENLKNINLGVTDNLQKVMEKALILPRKDRIQSVYELKSKLDKTDGRKNDTTPEPTPPVGTDGVKKKHFTGFLAVVCLILVARIIVSVAMAADFLSGNNDAPSVLDRTTDLSRSSYYVYYLCSLILEAIGLSLFLAKRRLSILFYDMVFVLHAAFFTYIFFATAFPYFPDLIYLMKINFSVSLIYLAIQIYLHKSKNVFDTLR
jgi:serine/threonine protein kinase